MKAVADIAILPIANFIKGHNSMHAEYQNLKRYESSRELTLLFCQLLILLRDITLCIPYSIKFFFLSPFSHKTNI